MAADYGKRHRLARVKNLFLKGVLGVYVIAFTSLYVQVKALFGDNGVAPIADLVKNSAAQKQELEAYNFILLAPKIGLSYGTFLELTCLTCTLVAIVALMARRLANILTFSFLWYVYFSIHQVGQGFMSFHSDLLLLEVGFLSILLAPFIPKSGLTSADHDHMPWFLVRWLVFRYFVTNVVHVYTDDDQAFYNLTAVSTVAQGAPFPSLVTWHIFNLPAEYQKLLQAFEHTLKLTIPFLFIFDFKYTRLFAFYTLLFITVGQFAFFNFGYTDLLIIVSLISVLKDSFFYSDAKAKQSTMRSILDIFCLTAFVAAVTHFQVAYFGITYAKSVLTLNTKFTPAQFKFLVSHLIPVAIAVGIFGFTRAVYKTFRSSSPRKTSIIKSFIYTLIATALFISTLPTLTKYEPRVAQKLKNLPFPLKLYNEDIGRIAASLKLVNNYIILSKVSQHYGDGRPELIIQSREDTNQNVWDQFDLRYKPGRQMKPLKFVAPHLPRIDLRMWYAARSSITNNQWLQTFVYRLATQQSDALRMAAPDNFIATTGQIRVAKYNYKYSLISKKPFAGYWSQVKFVDEYMPSVTVESLKQTVKANGISVTPSTVTSGSQESIEKVVNKYLDAASNYIRGVDHAAVVWTLLCVVGVSLIR